LYDCKKCNKTDSAIEKGFYTPYSAVPKGSYSANNITQEHGPKKIHGCLISFLIIVGLLLIFAIAGNHIPVSTVNTSVTGSSSNEDILKEMTPIRNKAQSIAISWATDNMQQFGKISDGQFDDGYDKSTYILNYKFRSPNVYGANEQHDLYLNYKKDASDWKLESVMLDGQSETIK
jgi:hypothetical protein